MILEIVERINNTPTIDVYVTDIGRNVKQNVAIKAPQKKYIGMANNKQNIVT